MALKNEYSGFCFHKQKLNKIDRIDKNISAEQFYLDYVLKRKPCLLKSEYIIGERCNIDINFMKENVENSYVELEQKVSNSFGIGKKKKMKFHKFLSLIEKGDSNYYLNTQYIKENPYGPTDFCNSITRQMINFLPKKLKIMGNLEIYQYNIWLGNNEDKNLKTFLHHDYHDNIYVLLKGKKIFRIYSPNFAYDLKTNGNINRIYNNGLITYSPFIRSDGSHYFDVYKKKIDKVYSDINTMNEHLNKENNLIEDKIIEKCINKAEKKLNKLENNILDYKLRKSKFQYKEKKRNDIPNHFCILNTTERKYELDIFNDNTDIKQKYIEVCMNEEDILYLPCGWFHEVKSFSGEKYHLAFNYWYYPPYIKMNSSGEAQNRFCHPYVDKYLSERNKNLYKKIGIFIKENVPNIKDILSYYINYDTKKFNSYVIDESINLIPLDNNLVHIKIKLNINGKDYKQFLPLNILKIFNYVKSLKINIKRGVYRNIYNNKYLDSYPFGFTLVVELKKREKNKNNFSKRNEYDEFSNEEVFLLRQLLNDIWSITGVSTNLLKIKDLIKVNNEIFAFLPDESICTESFSLIKKLYPCKNFGGLFNSVSPSYLISKLSSNIGFELNDDNENYLVMYVDYITTHDHKKDIKIIDLVNSKYNLNECPLIDRTALMVKKKKDNFIATILEKYGKIDLVYENINLYNILQNEKYNIIEEYINVNVIKEEANSIITADIKKKQSSLLYIFQNLNKKHNSDFLFVDKLPYYLSPLLHTIMIQGKYSNEDNKLKKQCDFIYFGHNAIKRFDVKFSNFDIHKNSSSNGNYYYFNFKHNLPPQCEVIIRFEVIKVQIRSFEFEFDIDRGILLGSGIFIQKRNNILQKNDDFMYKYTSSVLIDIILPDTSMPFNVIAISTCVIMLFFGFIFKLTAKEETRYV